ncbi:MAG TPA: type II toxin-antitoxin system RelE/ParE family toxin, partial [Roseiarcus sp.]
MANLPPSAYMVRNTREIAWIKGARKDFDEFPRVAQDELLDALSIVAEGGHPSVAKPLHGLGSGILELALRHRGEAFRVVYAVQIGAEIWVVHAFQKKAKSGIATPKAEVDLIRD